MKYFILTIILFYSILTEAQFPPAAGIQGSTAIHKDSTIITGWATKCYVTRGYINITDTLQTYTQNGITSNKAFFGHDSLAIGYPQNNMSCVSLGDGGCAILEFEKPITNGYGADFVVFENTMPAQASTDLFFIELAFVEVSSDGTNYVRFPATSNTQTNTQVNGFGNLNPTLINNFAGKYETNFGVPFDLDELKDSTQIDLNHITHIKIIDAIGILDSNYGNFDQNNRLINDPWPTPFWTGGFDLNAVGVIHFFDNQNIIENSISKNISIYPNPINPNNRLNISINNIPNENIKKIKIFSITGSLILKKICKDNKNKATIYTPKNCQSGIYIIQIFSKNNVYSKQLIIE